MLGPNDCDETDEINSDEDIEAGTASDVIYDVPEEIAEQ